MACYLWSNEGCQLHSCNVIRGQYYATRPDDNHRQDVVYVSSCLTMFLIKIFLYVYASCLLEDDQGQCASKKKKKKNPKPNDDNNTICTCKVEN